MQNQVGLSTLCQHVGEKELCDGSKLSLIDLRGSGSIAPCARESVRLKMQQQDLFIHAAAKWIGRATWLANHQPEAPRRDTTANRRATRIAKKLRATAAAAMKRAVDKRKLRAQRRPFGQGGHSIQPKARGVWACTACRSTAET